MRTGISLATAALALVALTGCATVDMFAPARQLDAQDTWLRTSAPVYTVTVQPTVYSVDIDLAYTNPLRRAVAVPACHTPYRPLLQKLENGEWVDAFRTIELMCITPPLVIAAGATHEFRFAVRAGRPAHVAPRFEVDEIPGTYRLIWGVGLHDRNADNGLGPPLPFEQRVSNTFELRF